MFIILWRGSTLPESWERRGSAQSRKVVRGVRGTEKVEEHWSRWWIQSKKQFYTMKHLYFPALQWAGHVVLINAVYLGVIQFQISARLPPVLQLLYDFLQFVQLNSRDCVAIDMATSFQILNYIAWPCHGHYRGMLASVHMRFVVDRVALG
jgi:hypothetical protein